MDINKNTGLVGLPPHPSLAPVAAFNEAQIENLLKTKGILAFHVKHALNYSKQTDQAGLDITASGIERPFVYYDVKPIRLVGQHFSLNESLTVMSLAATGDVVFNSTGTYLDDDSRVFMRPNDLILLNPDVTDMHQELVSFPGSSSWKLQYRCLRVDYMACQSQNRLEQDVDFTINQSGEIVFTQGAKAPKINEMVSVVYEFSPIYVIKVVPHVIRLLPSNTSGGSSPRVAVYAPQLVMASRSSIREDTTNWRQVLEDADWRKWLDF